MPCPRLSAWKFAQCLVLVSLSLRPLAVVAQATPSAVPNATTDSSEGVVDDSGEELPYGELAPAALQLDESKASPLIQELYGATRETKVPNIVARITQAKSLIDSGADVKATDSMGRTALHWAIFGSSYANNQDTIVAYEEVASDLIKHGVDINHEDTFNDTALDYLLYSPNFEMQTLLIENGATSGFLAASFNFINQLEICKAPEGLNPSLRSSINHGPGGKSFPAAVSIAQDPATADGAQ